MGYSKTTLALLFGAAISTKIPLEKKTTSGDRPFYTPIKPRLGAPSVGINGEELDTELGSALKAKLVDHQNMMYTGSLSLGSEKAENNLVFDTGSGWLTVATQLCEECNGGGKYDYTKSSTSKILDNGPEDLYYGSAHLTGKYISDTACVAGDCVKGFEFFGITKETGLQGVDGILGLSPDMIGNGPSFFDALDQSGLTNGNHYFGYFIGDESQTSEIFFGGVDDSKIKKLDGIGDKEGFLTYDLAGYSWWQLNLKGGEIGGTKFATASTTIVDSGTSLIAITQSDWATFAKALTASNPDFQCDSTQGLCYKQGVCDGSSPDLSFSFDGEYYFVVPGATTEIQQEQQGQKFCINGVMGGIPDEQDMYILGDVFLRNFYAKYDMQNYQVGLAVDAYNNGTIVKRDPPHDEFLTQ